MVRGRDACWEHCVLVDATRQKVRCNYCHREFSGGVYRMKFHLAQIKNKDIVPCAEVPDDVRDHIQSILSTPKKQKNPKKPKVDRAANGQQNSSSASGGNHLNHGSSGQHGSTCPSLLFPHPLPSLQPAENDAQKQKQDDADKKIAAFYFHNSIPFSAAKSVYYQEMVKAVAECGVDYKAPSYEKFWKSAHEAVSMTEPLVKMLRIVDGDMPAMGYIYEGIERAKLSIQAYYKGVEEKYMPIWNIIDRRWNVQLLPPLHAAAAFLNPSIFYNPNFKIDLKMRNGFQEAMVKLATTDKEKIEITKEHPLYINAQGALGTDFAIMGRTLNAPGDWWASYGYEIPTLQRAAIRILSQPCSSHWCRWNWSTFESVHSKKRNKVELEKFNDLVFVHCSLWLQGICKSRDRKCKPIIYDEIDVSLEWPTELESSAPLSDDSWLDNLPLECRNSP
ncbi:hypothetical protein Patl1_05100 [Pistacia atlantica]|uniref:Uncharacterized protein n=1 Tax=Pistacia atlantica TaxID=434234 RepID=A0ACC1BUZ4_9ROSI|nr:hypothetical protein Patl1_05100 [Pistacia atlantica]